MTSHFHAIWQNLLMYHPYVMSKIGHNIKSPFANVTAEWFFLTVNKHVMLQLALGGKCFCAFMAPERFYLEHGIVGWCITCSNNYNNPQDKNYNNKKRLKKNVNVFFKIKIRIKLNIYKANWISKLSQWYFTQFFLYCKITCGKGSHIFWYKLCVALPLT